MNSYEQGYQDALNGLNRGYRRNHWYNDGYDKGYYQLTMRGRVELAVRGYRDGYAGKPKESTVSRYVEGYRLGARKRKAGGKPARFTLWNE